MGLTRNVHHVRAIRFGDGLGLADGVLTVPTAEAEAFFAGPPLASVTLSVVAPGESARIVKVLDAVEPRTKGPGGGGIFPGFVSPADDGGAGAATVAGQGVTHVLRGAAVVVAGYLPRAQEAVIDMSGPAADLSPLAQTVNLVVEFEPDDGAAWEDVDIALRLGSLRLAAWLAEAGLDVEPDVVEEPLEPAAADGMPKVAALTNLQTQGTFKDVFVYGKSFAGEQPRVVEPGE
ncbi:MAG: hypothetical protein QOE93_1103, partial [Actinomycetota bacterium]|nr:hypothetical protein [Actinomycetota bacterium]